MQFLIFPTSGFIIFFVILNLLNASKVFAFIYFIIIVIIYYFISNRTNFILKKNSKKISNNTDLIIKKIQESLISIRDIIMYQSEKIQYSQFYNYSKELRRLESNNFIISTFPRFLIESLAISLIILSTIILLLNKQSFNLGIIGLFALGSQKLLPLFQNSYLNFSFIKGKIYSINKVISYLKLKINDEDNFDNYFFDFNQIEFKNVGLSFSDRKILFLKTLI